MEDATREQAERRETDKAHEKVLSAHAVAAYTQRQAAGKPKKCHLAGILDSCC